MSSCNPWTENAAAASIIRDYQPTAEDRAQLDKVLTVARENGLTAEIRGVWCWISGDTKPAKDALKKVGCYWARTKSMWYWRPKATAHHYKHYAGKDIEDIRHDYAESKF